MSPIASDPEALEKLGHLGDVYYTFKVFDPKAKRDATAAIATLLDAGWSAEEAYRVVRLVETPDLPAPGWPNDTNVTAESIKIGGP